MKPKIIINKKPTPRAETRILILDALMGQRDFKLSKKEIVDLLVKNEMTVYNAIDWLEKSQFIYLEGGNYCITKTGVAYRQGVLDSGDLSARKTGEDLVGWNLQTFEQPLYPNQQICGSIATLHECPIPCSETMDYQGYKQADEVVSGIIGILPQMLAPLNLPNETRIILNIKKKINS